MLWIALIWVMVVLLAKKDLSVFTNIFTLYRDEKETTRIHWVLFWRPCNRAQSMRICSVWLPEHFVEMLMLVCIFLYSITSWGWVYKFHALLSINEYSAWPIPHHISYNLGVGFSLKRSSFNGHSIHCVFWPAIENAFPPQRYITPSLALWAQTCLRLKGRK